MAKPKDAKPKKPRAKATKKVPKSKSTKASASVKSVIQNKIIIGSVDAKKPRRKRGPNKPKGPTMVPPENIPTMRGFSTNPSMYETRPNLSKTPPERRLIESGAENRSQLLLGPPAPSGGLLESARQSQGLLEAPASNQDIATRFISQWSALSQEQKQLVREQRLLQRTGGDVEVPQTNLRSEGILRSAPPPLVDEPSPLQDTYDGTDQSAFDGIQNRISVIDEGTIRKRSGRPAKEENLKRIDKRISSITARLSTAKKDTTRAFLTRELEEAKEERRYYENLPMLNAPFPTQMDEDRPIVRRVPVKSIVPLSQYQTPPLVASPAPEPALVENEDNNERYDMGMEDYDVGPKPVFKESRERFKMTGEDLRSRDVQRYRNEMSESAQMADEDLPLKTNSFLNIARPTINPLINTETSWGGGYTPISDSYTAPLVADGRIENNDLVNITNFQQPVKGGRVGALMRRKEEWDALPDGTQVALTYNQANRIYTKQGDGLVDSEGRQYKGLNDAVRKYKESIGDTKGFGSAYSMFKIIE
jgi:hypothetical protein